MDIMQIFLGILIGIPIGGVVLSLLENYLEK